MRIAAMMAAPQMLLAVDFMVPVILLKAAVLFGRREAKGFVEQCQDVSAVVCSARPVAATELIPAWCLSLGDHQVEARVRARCAQRRSRARQRRRVRVGAQVLDLCPDAGSRIGE